MVPAEIWHSLNSTSHCSINNKQKKIYSFSDISRLWWLVILSIFGSLLLIVVICYFCARIREYMSSEGGKSAWDTLHCMKISHINKWHYCTGAVWSHWNWHVLCQIYEDAGTQASCQNESFMEVNLGLPDIPVFWDSPGFFNKKKILCLQ